MIGPNGNPHQPKKKLNTASPSLAFAPQARQHTRERLDQRVTLIADHTRCETCTSTGPGPWQRGHLP